MSEEDEVFNFIKSLNSYGTRELVKDHRKDLAAEMAFVDILLGFNFGGRSPLENIESSKAKGVALKMTRMNY